VAIIKLLKLNYKNRKKIKKEIIIFKKFIGKENGLNGK